MVICDAHAHPGEAEELAIRKWHSIATFLCATDPETARQVDEICNGTTTLFPTYGLHPWYADRFDVTEMLPYLQRGHLIGEIGLDSVWCEVPIKRQQEVFVEQLALAERFKMPVILHTKGQEKQVLECIQRFQMPILVHWYSAAHDLEGYLKKDCFFSIGPDVRKNPAVQRIVRMASLNRLLVETDGMEAVRWAIEKQDGEIQISNQNMPKILMDSMVYISQIKQVSIAAVADQLEQNFNYLKNFSASQSSL